LVKKRVREGESTPVFTIIKLIKTCPVSLRYDVFLDSTLKGFQGLGHDDVFRQLVPYLDGGWKE
jgi:hypothetical protein